MKSTLFKKIFVIVLCILIAIPFILAIFYKAIGCDSSYYLSAIALVSEGKHLYSDIPFGYTPVFIYLMAGIKNLLGITINYGFDLSVYFIIFTIDIILCYYLSLFFLKDSFYSFLASLFFAVASQRLEGLALLLEIPAVLWGLLGLCLILYKNGYLYYAFSGILMGLAFLTKQYGAGFFLLGILLFISYKKNSFKSISVYLCSSLLTITLFLLIFPGLINIIGGQGYSGYSNENRLDFTNNYLTSMLRLFKHLPAFLFALCLTAFALYKRWFNKESIKVTTFLLCAIFGFMGQFLFGPFAHYYIFLLPFVAIFVFYLFINIKSPALKYSYTAVIVVTTLILYGRVYHNYLINDIISDERKYQIELANHISSIATPNATLYIADGGLYSTYYLSGMRAPEYNYSFGNLPERYYIEAILASDYVLAYNEKQEATLNTKDIKNLLNADFIPIILNNGGGNSLQKTRIASFPIFASYS